MRHYVGQRVYELIQGRRRTGTIERIRPFKTGGYGIYVFWDDVKRSSLPEFDLRAVDESVPASLPASVFPINAVDLLADIAG